MKHISKQLLTLLLLFAIFLPLTADAQAAASVTSGEQTLFRLLIFLLFDIFYLIFNDSIVFIYSFQTHFVNTDSKKDNEECHQKDDSYSGSFLFL